MIPFLMTIVSAAVSNVIVPPAPVNDVWDETVSYITVDNGVPVDIRHPVITAQTALVGGGRFGDQALRYTNSERFTLGSTPINLVSDFTIEGHFIFDSVARTNQYMLDLGSNGFTLRYYQSEGICVSQGGSFPLSSGLIPVTDKWYHVAVVRRNGLLQLYVEGIMLSQSTFTGTLGYSTITFGNYGSGGTYSMVGRIGGARIVTRALYNGNFTPPDAPFPIGSVERDYDPYWNDVALEVQSGDPEAVDAKGLSVIQRVGNAAMTTTKKIGSMGMAIPDASSFFSIPANQSNFDLTSVPEWTIELWAMPTATNTGIGYLIGRGNSSQMGGWSLVTSNMRPQARMSSNGTSWNQSTTAVSGSNIPLGRWTHVAMTRYENTLMIFVSGKPIGSVAYSGSIASTLPVTIGNAADGSSPFIGHISGLRFTKKCRYTQMFTPRMVNPYSSVSSISGTGDPHFGKVTSLFEFSDNRSAGVKQYGVNVRGGEITSDYQLFGKNTLMMNTGASGGIFYTMAPNASTLGTAGGTIEGWINTNYSNSLFLPFIGQHHATATGAWAFGISSGKARMFIRGGIDLTGGPDIADGQWHYVAAVISGTSVVIFVDDDIVATGTTTTAPTYNGNLQIGYNVATEAAAGFRLNVSRFKTTQAVSRYTAGFVPSEDTVSFFSVAA